MLAPGGTFEGSLDGWKLTGGAKVVAGSEPFAVHGAGEKNALSLPSGSSATTPQVCVGVLDPTMRFFAANDGGLLSLMSISILFYPPGGGVITLPLGVNLGGKAWAPSLPTLVTANLLGVLNGGEAKVAFRFTPIGLGAKWRIDDVYVDPMAATRSSGCANAVRRWPSAARRAARAGPPRCGPARVPRRRAGRRSGPARRRLFAGLARPRRAPTTSRRRRACRSKASPPNARAVLRPPRWRTTTSGCRTVGTPAACARRHRSMSS